MSIKKDRLNFAVLTLAASVFFSLAQSAFAETNFAVGFNYSKGYPSYGGGGYFGGGGYGGGGYWGGYPGSCGGYMPPAMPPMPPIAGGGCYTCGGGGGGFYPPGGGGGFPPGGGGHFGPPPMPAFPPLPPPAPILPPHLAMPNMGWGNGFNSYPGPINSGGGCIPCSMGYMQQPMGPVPGGPAIYNGGVGLGYGSGGAGFYGSGDATADIVWATAMGMGMQATNVYPLAIPRYDPTIIPPTWFGLGPRPSSIIQRPHAP